jgi:4-amino-4-deoxy-L-arabinose transferase-like glycosyltransferase
MSSHTSNLPESRWSQYAVALIALAAILRLIALALNPLELYADETQYWVWSRNFDWGYFSKPPVIAWAIAASTTIFGDTDFAVRLPAPLLNIATAGFIFLTARRLWDARTGFWAVLVFVTMPAVWVSNAVISTDTPMLAAWSAALYCLVSLRQGGGWAFAVGMGAAIGLGFMSKYAMIYFAIGTGLAVLFDPATRRALLSARGALVAALALALWAPNLLWNAANDFATVTHTAANANWGGTLFHFDELADFLSAQLGVFGPALFVILIAIIFRTLRQRNADHPDALFLLVFTLPPLLTVSFQAFISRAHANWAVSAYVAATLLVTFFLLQGPRWRRTVLYASIALHTLLGAFAIGVASSPSFTEAVGMSNSTKRIRAWQETADAITQYGQQRDYTAIVFDNRNIFHQMQRYGGAMERPLAMWLRYSGPVNHAEQEWPLAEQFDGEILIVSERPREVPKMREDFAIFEHVADITIPLDGNKTREFTLWRAGGHQRVVRDLAYEERWTAIDAAREGR